MNKQEKITQEHIDNVFSHKFPDGSSCFEFILQISTEDGIKELMKRKFLTRKEALKWIDTAFYQLINTRKQ